MKEIRTNGGTPVLDVICLQFVWWILAFGVGFRLSPDYQDLSYDELYSVVHAYRFSSYSQLFHVELMNETHPPLFQTFLYLWVKLVGVSEELVRLPSVIFSVFAVAFAYFRGTKLFSRYPAWLFTCLLAVSFGGIRFAREARSYSLVLLLCVVLLFEVQRLASRSGVIAYKQLLPLTIIGLVIGYTHHLASLVFFSSVFSLMVFQRKSTMQYLGVGLTVFIGLVPWLSLSFLHMHVDRINWISSRPFEEILQMFVTITSYDSMTALAWVCLSLSGGLFLWAKHQKLSHQTKIHALTLTIALSLHIAVNWFQPLFVLRYLLVYLPTILLLVAIGAGSWIEYLKQQGDLRMAVPVTVTVASLLVVTLWDSGNYALHFKKPRWRLAMDHALTYLDQGTVYCVLRSYGCSHYLEQRNQGARNPVGFVNLKLGTSAPKPTTEGTSVLLGIRKKREIEEAKRSFTQSGWEVVHSYFHEKAGFIAIRPRRSNADAPLAAIQRE